MLGIIPARGGSKGIPGKNIRMLGGKPLIYYAVRAARESGLVDRLILTTEARLSGVTPETLVDEIVQRTPVPALEPADRRQF